MNLNAFRIGLNWPALRPAPTNPFALDGGQLDYYRQVLETVKSRGMSTFVTLFHFCLPHWLAELGGWNNPRTIEEFGLYGETVARELGDLVDFWLTLNEPLVYIYQGFINGIWPPGYRKNYLRGFQGIRALLNGHARAYAAIKGQIPHAQISFTVHWRPFVARDRFSPLDHLTRYARDQVFNHVFLMAIESGELNFPFPISAEKQIKLISGTVPGLKGAMDFLALNYFTREICEFVYSWPLDIFGAQSQLVPLETTGLGWEIYPEGLYYLLTEDVAPYRYDREGELRPIFIAENGMGMRFPAHISSGDWSLDDEQRVRYLISHLVALHQAIGDGANVKGYLHWSLIDNFEWSDGLESRFGLVRVAYPDQGRALRKSAGVYAEIAGANRIDSEYLQLVRTMSWL